MRLSEEKITRGNAVAVKAAVLASAQAGDTVLDFSNVKSVDSTTVSILMSWVCVLQNARLTPEIRCVPEKMLSLMRLYGVDGLLVPYFK